MSYVNPTRLELANAIRFLAIDAVQAANSGHPGMPIGMADIAEVKLTEERAVSSPSRPSTDGGPHFRADVEMLAPRSLRAIRATRRVCGTNSGLLSSRSETTRRTG